MDAIVRHSLFILSATTVCIAACIPTLFSQEKNSFANFNPRFEVFTLPGGPSANLVQDIEQDANGMIWFGTTAGLIRYDGQHFFTYRYDPVNPNSLSSDLVEDIFPDSKGILWLTHWEGGGLTAFDPEREIFTRYRHDPDDSTSLSSNTNSVVAEDRQGYIWVGGQEGLDRLDRSTGKFKRFHHDPADPGSLSHNQVRALYVDKQGTLWAGTGTPWDLTDRQHKLGGLNRFDPATGKFTRYLHNPADPQSVANNKVRAIFEDSKGNFWVGTAGDGLQRLDRKTGKFERLTYDPAKPEKLSRPYLRNLAPAAHAGDSNVTSILEDQKGRIWITAYPGGLNVFDPTAGATRHFEARKGEGNLTTNYLWKTFQTRDGTTWIAGASFGQAVFKVKQQGDLFPFFSTLSRPEDTTGWSHGILKDRAGNIWRVQDFPNIINTVLPAELQRIDRRTGKKTVIPLGDPKQPVQGIWSLSLDREGKIWVGTEQGQFRGDPETGVFRLFQPKGAPADVLQKLWSPVLHTRSGQFWLGGINQTGVCRYDPKTENFTCYRHDPADPGSLGGDLTWGLYEDDRGDVWVGGGDPDGNSFLPIFLDRFNAQTNTFEHFIKEQKQFGMAISITGDKTGNIWFTDSRNGFQKLNPATGALKKFTRFNSLLPSQNLHSIMLANDGKLWLSEEGSLIAFDPETETMSVFDSRHGVRTANGYFRSGNIAADGELLFSRMGGFHAFYPEQLRREKDINPPDLRLTGFRLLGVRIAPDSPDQGRGVLEKPIWQTSHLHLAHDQNVFSFSLACFDFADPAANQIQFKLENFDRDWRKDLHEGETPPYINVPPGSYTFRVRGANSFGAWNMDGVNLKIIILPPWWKTWWAYLSYGLLALAAIYFLDREQRRRIVQRERRKMLEKEVAHAKEIEKAYADLKAAQIQLEIKNRNLEIEASLERVRTRTMAMHQSDDLLNVITVVGIELHQIGIPFDWVNILTDAVPKEGLTAWQTVLGLPEPLKVYIPHFDHVLFHAIEKLAVNNAEVWSYSLDENELKLWFEHVFSKTTFKNLPDELKQKRLSAKRGDISVVALKNNVFLSLAIHDGAPYTEEENNIIKRFGKVFEQAYTRFLDLQKAEALVREAQIEAALEKVRASTMAMHKSEELQEVVNSIFEKFRELNIEVGTANILIFQEDSHDMVCWTSNHHQRPVNIPHTDVSILNDLNEAKNSGLKLFSRSYPVEEKNRLFEYFFEKTDFKYIPEERKSLILASTKYALSAAFYGNVGVQLTSYTKDSFSTEENKILERFAGVFYQAYTRFLDLKKSEEQAQALVQEKQRLEKTLTELRGAQNKLIQSEKLASLGELTAGIAHEIQNPLNFVNNFSELSVELSKELTDELEKEPMNKDLIKELIGDLTSNQQKINHHGKRASSIVTGMLQHARTNTGKKEPTDLNALADEYLRLAYHGLRAKDSSFNAKMVTDFDPTIGKVEVIPQDIGRVFLNIINNAFYATQQRAGASDGGTSSAPSTSPYEPTVSISSKKENGRVVFKIKDNGTGIPDDVKAKIFQPFFTTKPTGQGTGLGLSLAYDIVTKGHGGTLEVETREGEGTEFVLTIPFLK